MKFEWDESKNNINIKKHNISFSNALTMFNGPMITGLDQRFDYEEERWVGLGLLKSGGIGVVSFTERKNGIIRIISARKATKYETGKYQNFIG